MNKRYTRAQFLRSGGRLHIAHKIELGPVEIVERKSGKHKRKKMKRRGPE